MFILIGKVIGREAQVTWDQGVITGDNELVKRITMGARALEGIDVSFPTMEGTTYNHLANPLSALYLIRNTFDEVLCSKGKVPQLPRVRKGAIS